MGDELCYHIKIEYQKPTREQNKELMECREKEGGSSVQYSFNIVALEQTIDTLEVKIYAIASNSEG